MSAVQGQSYDPDNYYVTTNSGKLEVHEKGTGCGGALMKAIGELFGTRAYGANADDFILKYVNGKNDRNLLSAYGIVISKKVKNLSDRVNMIYQMSTLSPNNRIRIDVFNDTKAITKAREYTNLQLEPVKLKVENMLSSVRVYAHAIPRLDLHLCPNYPLEPHLDGSTIHDMSTLELVKKLKKTYPDDSVAAMILGNKTTPGGKAGIGEIAQEEAAMYATTGEAALQKAYKQGGYPIPEDGAIYANFVEIIKTDEEQDQRSGILKGNTLLDQPVEMAIIDICAYDLTSEADLRELGFEDLAQKAKVIYDKRMENIKAGLRDGDDVRTLTTALKEKTDKDVAVSKKFRDGTALKVRNFMRIAATYGHERVVLGAPGCGMFKNPPDVVAGICATVAKEVEFNGWFKSIDFAIKCGSDKRNVDEFKKHFPDEEAEAAAAAAE